MNKEPFFWDEYSDQPKIIRNKLYKNAIRKKHIKDFLKLFFTSVIIFPFALLLMKFFRKDEKIFNNDFYGIGVNLDKGSFQQELVDELGIKHLIIRIPLWDISNINLYLDFAESFNNTYKKNILINILQDRQNIEDLNLLRNNLELIFTNFENISNEFQIGTTINRTKWGFFSVSEYINFYKIAQDLKEEKFTNIKLLGPSVIDFEYYYNVRAMFNFRKVKYDIISSLLYVDRRGSPKNKQYLFFDLKNKIDFLFCLVKLSFSCKSDNIYITETNWPIINTQPYAPTSQKECVTNEEYTKFMLNYFQIAKESKKIKRVYWHQLIAPGYGLVDNRNGEIIKYPQFYAFKELLENERNN